MRDTLTYRDTWKWSTGLPNSLWPSTQPCIGKKNVLWETTIARSDRLLTVFSNLELYTVAGLVLNENVKTVKIKVSKSMTQKFINTSERNCPWSYDVFFILIKWFVNIQPSISEVRWMNLSLTSFPYEALIVQLPSSGRSMISKVWLMKPDFCLNPRLSTTTSCGFWK